MLTGSSIDVTHPSVIGVLLPTCKYTHAGDVFSLQCLLLYYTFMVQCDSLHKHLKLMKTRTQRILFNHRLYLSRSAGEKRDNFMRCTLNKRLIDPVEHQRRKPRCSTQSQGVGGGGGCGQ